MCFVHTVHSPLYCTPVLVLHKEKKEEGKLVTNEIIQSFFDFLESSLASRGNDGNVATLVKMTTDDLFVFHNCQKAPSLKFYFLFLVWESSLQNTFFQTFFCHSQKVNPLH